MPCSAQCSDLNQLESFCADITREVLAAKPSNNRELCAVLKKFREKWSFSAKML